MAYEETVPLINLPGFRLPNDAGRDGFGRAKQLGWQYPRTTTTEDISLHIFCLVDDKLPKIEKHPQAKLYPSELVPIGILFARKGGFFRAF
ncbi:MAG: hypothetical protein QGD88_11535 [Anaerolineae bacterium]|nr:hypothetical protein [Anaerolineae bacterium]